MLRISVVSGLVGYCWDSLTCSYVRSNAIFHVMYLLENPLYTWESMRVNKANNVLVLLWKSFWPLRSHGVSRAHFENCWSGDHDKTHPDNKETSKSCKKWVEHHSASWTKRSYRVKKLWRRVPLYGRKGLWNWLEKVEVFQ